MTKEQRDQLLNDATIGLKGDPELRLDVKQELASHLEAATDAYRDSGKTEAESLDLAAKTFGSPLEMATELQAANLNRMKWRALARLAAGALLVPGAIAVAWLIATPTLKQTRGILSSINLIGFDILKANDFMQDQQQTFERHLPPEKRLILFGDKSRLTAAEQQRAIWEKDPTNQVFYGNYITYLISTHQGATNQGAIIQMEKALREGERLDPDNARYNYLLAHLLLNKAAEINQDKTPAGNTNKQYRMIIKDRALLDQAMSEYAKGNAKPFWTPRTREMFLLRMSLLPLSRNMLERLWKIGMAAGLVLPDLTQQRQLARAGILYGDLLLSENRRNDALPFLESWYPQSRKLFSGGFTLIDQLVAFAIVRMGNEQGTPALAAAGETRRAELMQRRAKAILAPQDQWTLRRKQVQSEADENDFENSAGPLIHMLLPAIGEPYPTKADMTCERLIWYVLMEEAASMALVYVLLSMMVMMLIVYLRWRWTKGFASAPLLILPDTKHFLKILGYSILLPLLIYFVFTRYSGLSGQERSMLGGHYWIVPLEIFTLALVIIFLSVLLSVRHSWRRCRDLGIPVPATMSGWKIFILANIPFVLPLWWLMWGKREGLFRGTVARSLIPIFACATILIGLTTQPYLTFREYTLVQNDPLLSFVEQGAGFSKPEAQLVDRLQREALAAFDSIEKNP